LLWLFQSASLAHLLPLSPDTPQESSKCRRSPWPTASWAGNPGSMDKRGKRLCTRPDVSRESRPFYWDPLGEEGLRKALPGAGLISRILSLPMQERMSENELAHASAAIEPRASPFLSALIPFPFLFRPWPPSFPHVLVLS
jgi:hypothetical protein